MYKNILDQIFWGNKVLDYLVSIAIFLTACACIKIFKHILLKRLSKWAEKTAVTFDDFIVSILEKAVVPFLYFGAFYLGIRALKLNDYFAKVMNTLGMGILTFFIVNLLIKVVTYAFQNYWRKNTKDEVLEHSLTGALKIIKFTIWSLAVVFFLDNLGFKISTVIAGLGIGGVAIALAAQALLKDLFSYFSIIFDRPFEVGDFVIVGDLMGTIEHVGIKTTRLRSLGGEQLVFSNSDLTDSRLRNYKRMEKRRVVFTLGVVYQTPLEKLKEIPKIIEKAVRGIEDTLFDRAHFFSYGDFSLVFEVVYYVTGSDYNKYMDIQQKINFVLKEEFEKKEIEFAFPTQTLYLAK